MASVVVDLSMSLDGYITAADQTTTEPMGNGGEVLHDWGNSDDPVGRELAAAAVARYGAVIAGRVTYEHHLPFWGANGPKGTARRPVFVVTREPPACAPEVGVYEFVTDGLNEALIRAQAAAGDSDVEVLGGAVLARQFVEAGLVDEIVIHLVPVVLGDGTRLFEAMKIDRTRLQVIEVVQSRAATHLRYRELKSAAT
jgi:dihydrofolate reductase